MGKPIDNPARKRLTEALSAARHRELMYVETALHSAESAAIQVLDKRVEFLERPDEKQPERFELREFFLDVLVDLVVGQVGGQLLQAGVEGLLAPILRSRQAYYVTAALKIEPKDFKVSPKNAETKIHIDQLKQARGQARRKLQDHFTQVVSSQDYKAYKLVPEMLVGSLLEVGSDAARTAANVGGDKLADPAGSAREGNTPIVEILTSAQHAYLLQKTAVERLYDSLVATVQYADIDVETAKEWEAFLAENVAAGFGVDPMPAIRRYRALLGLYYEAAMWAHMIDLKSVVVRTGPLYSRNLMGDARRDQYFNDENNYKITQEDQRGVAYELPEDALLESGYGGGTRTGPVQAKKKIGIPRERLDYWINHFPASFEDLAGPTILQWHETRYHKQGGSEKQKAIMYRVGAYEDVLRLFGDIDQALLKSFRALKDVSALRP